ncbi:MAG: AI-2E family transporter [Pirellulales bacterium]|nr:AI-2E family transporter [Pirellulales bacterium]
MARIVSFVVLLVILLLIFGLFFQVMADFLLPMFLAVLLVIMFGPLHRWFQARCKGRDRLAAVLTTTAILLVFFVPASFILLRAAQEGGNLYRKVIRREVAAETKANAARTPSAAEKTEPVDNSQKGLQWFSAKITLLGGKIGLNLKEADIKKALHAKMEEYLTPLAVSTGQFLLKFLAGAFVMVISLYYFLADGPAMVRGIMRLSPLDDKYEEQLIEQFGNVTRAVVVATLLSALVQGILAGIGFYFAGAGSVFLLTVLAMMFAIIPFIGSAGVWVPVCLWIYFVEERTWPAILLAVYCAGIVSTVDNLIKPLVLHGRSNIHPLLALLSVLGGVQALGPIGIVVGPMAVAFLQTLLEMINKEMAAISKEKAVVAGAK